MKVFLSWSGERSRQLAMALRDWLPCVIQSVEPWLSSEDTPIGSRWIAEISSILAEVDIGILCLTPENLNSPWLLYEAGALSKNVPSSRICPLLLDLRPDELTGPLFQFQCIASSKNDVFRLLSMLNRLGGESQLSERVLERSFEANWPWLEERLHALRMLTVTPQNRPLTADEKLDQILRLLQQQSSHPIFATMELTTLVSPENRPPPAVERPRIFIGSSGEGLPVAEAIQLGLEDVAECTVWNQSVFDPSKTVIESLVNISREFDCAILVCTPDDLTITRGESAPSPRDNIIFEAGLFTGSLGRARTFLIYSQGPPIHLPSDLLGVTAATYRLRPDGNLHAALGPVCTRIKRVLGLV